MRQIFKDEKHSRLFNRDGFIRLKVFDAHAIGQIEIFFLENSDQDFSGWHHSMELPSSKQKIKIHQFLAQLFDEHLSGYFNQYRAIACTFVSKKADADSAVYPHQDWCFVDEAEFTSSNLWIPLCDTNADNGTLGVVRGSHRLKQNIRGSNISQNLPGLADLLKYLTFIDMKAGEVLIHDHRLVHTSAANKSDRPRTVANINIIPAEAVPVHYLGDKLGKSSVLELAVDNEFYYNYHMDKLIYSHPSLNQMVKTEGYRRKEIPYTGVRIDEQDLERLHEARGIAVLRRLRDSLKAKLPFNNTSANPSD